MEWFRILEQKRQEVLAKIREKVKGADNDPREDPLQQGLIRLTLEIGRILRGHYGVSSIPAH